MLPNKKFLTERWSRGFRSSALSLAVSLLVVSSVQAATYYIDFVSGADSGAGTSKTAPWKNAPGMQGCSGSCAAYSHALGDRFIFKGGVTWDHTVFPWNFIGGGNAGTYDYYGVDQTWFVGGSFARPVFDGEFISSDMLEVNPSYVTVDNFEAKRIALPPNVSGQWSIGLPATGFVTVQNCYVHNWKANAGSTVDGANGGIGGSAYDPVHASLGTVIDHCTIENSEQAARMNGMGVRMVETVSNSIIHDAPNGIVFARVVTGNHIYNIDAPFASFDPAYHTNIVYFSFPNGDGLAHTQIMYNNVFNTSSAGTNMYILPCEGGHSDTVYSFNNLLYDLQDPVPTITIDQSNAAGTCGSVHLWNNLGVRPTGSVAASIRVDTRGGNVLSLLDSQNNFFITNAVSTALDYESPATLINTGNIVMDIPTATSQGYVVGSLYAPTAAGNATVGAGANLTGNCSGLLTSLCSDTTLGGTRTPKARPSSGAWDAGAYQFSGGAPPPDTQSPTVPTGLVATAASSSQINLTWTASSDNVGVTGYTIRRNGSVINTSPTNSYSDAGLTASTLYSYTVDAFDAAGNHSAPSAAANATTPAGSPPPTGQTLLTTQTPVLTGLNDGVDYELGTRFQSNLAGQITAIRFWKDAAESGTHTGHLWDASGNLLATVAFTNETSSGWQQQSLGSPLSIAADNEYLVSVNTGNMGYVATNSGLASSIVSGNLSSIVGTNGRYGPVNSYPTQSHADSNYFRDVVFNPSGATDNQPPSVPTGLAATAASSSQINLTWTASSDNVGVAGYTIRRNGSVINTSPTNSYTDSGLTASTLYSYTVDAFDAAGNHSAQSTAASATTQAVASGGGGTWYVDNALSSGSNNGTSWANAWRSMAAVSWAGMQAGDTLYISGGSTAQIYTENWAVNKGGTAGNPITISVGQTAGHNGTVIFDYNADGDNSTRTGIAVNQDDVKFTGNVGGANHFQINNIRNVMDRLNAIGIGGSGRTGITVDHLTFINDNNPIRIGDSSVLSIHDCSFQGVRGDAAIGIASGVSSTWDTNTLYNNYIETVSNDAVPPGGSGAYNGPDGIQSGDGCSIYNNTFKSLTTTVYTSTQHPDKIQESGGNNVKIYNNEFINVGDSDIDISIWGANAVIKNIWIYNNIFRIEQQIDSYPDYIRVYANPGNISELTNLKIFNNLFVDNNSPYSSNCGNALNDTCAVHFGPYGGNPIGTGNEIRNNIFYNSGFASRPALGITDSSAFTAGTFALSNNVFYAGGSINYRGTTYSPANWVASGNDPNSSTAQPIFTSYTVNGTNNNFHLLPTDTAAKDAGISLSAYFTTDKDGATRPQGPAWDKGAFELAAGGSVCDVNQDAATNVIDVQQDVNAALGVVACSAAYDINKDNLCNVIDVQRVVNAALGGLCVSP